MRSKSILIVTFILLVAASFLLFNTLHLQAMVRDLETARQSLEQENAALSENLANSNQRLRDLESRGQDSGGNAGKTAYLTFDDGPSANTLAILDLLKEYQVKATFFVIANNSQQSRQIYQRIVDEGHSLGLHGYVHDYAVAYQSADAYMSNLYRLQDFLFEVVGQRPTISRFLGGSNTGMSTKYGGPELAQDVIARMEADGLRYFDWNVSSADTSRPVVEAQVIADTVLSGAKGRKQAVVLMHDAPIKATTVEALPQIIEGLRAQGFGFAALTAESPEVHFQIR